MRLRDSDRFAQPTNKGLALPRTNSSEYLSGNAEADLRTAETAYIHARGAYIRKVLQHTPMCFGESPKVARFLVPSYVVGKEAASLKLVPYHFEEMQSLLLLKQKVPKTSFAAFGSPPFNLGAISHVCFRCHPLARLRPILANAWPPPTRVWA